MDQNMAWPISMPCLSPDSGNIAMTQSPTFRVEAELFCTFFWFPQGLLNVVMSQPFWLNRVVSLVDRPRLSKCITGGYLWLSTIQVEWRGLDQLVHSNMIS